MNHRRAWRGNRQPITWFIDLHRRGLLELDPPYQRRSVWNQRYREDFVETILLGYPAPSLFLYEDIADDGSTRYAVVDGKQRLTTVIDYTGDAFATSEEQDTRLPPDQRGRYFQDLTSDQKQEFWSYEFTVEYLPSTDEALLNEVFDRINRNVAKLTRQELRHARFSGVFAQAMEDLAGTMADLFDKKFPRIVESSQRQMKDVEFVVQLVLLIERGPEATSQDEYDRIYAERDDDWEHRSEVRQRLRLALDYVRELLQLCPDLASTRLRNQGDFYALVGAVDRLGRLDELPPADDASQRLFAFAESVGDEETVNGEETVRRYYEAARSAANDTRQREMRIEILERAMRPG